MEADEVTRNFDQAIIFHKKMIGRARTWAIVSTLAGVTAISIGLLLLNKDNAEMVKNITTIGGFALSAIGLAWPLREIYNIKNRMEALKMFRMRYDGPPPPSDDDKKKIKDTVDTIINKSI